MKLDEIHHWLRHELGQGNYAWASDTQPGNDACAIFLPSIGTAQRLVDKFEPELLLIEDMKTRTKQQILDLAVKNARFLCWANALF